MKTAFITIGLCIGFISSGFAQQAKVSRMEIPFAGSVNLSQVEDKYNAQVYNLEMPEPDGEVDQIKLQEAKEKIKQLFPRQQKNTANMTTTIAAPQVLISYVSDSISGIPSDNYMAVSKQNTTVSVMNSSIAVQNGLTGQITSKKNLRFFSNVVQLNSITNDYRYDPKIIYDPEADKFICVMLNGTDDHNWIVLGFSHTNDPTGVWNFYKLYGDYAGDTTWFDYPSIAMTHKEFFLTGNKIKYNTSWQAGFTQTVIYQIRKQDGYDSLSLTTQLWENTNFNGQNIRNLFPVIGGRNITGPSQYFLSNRNFDTQNDSIFLVKIPDTIGSGNTNLTVQALVSNLNYGVPPDGRQPDTSLSLATNDGRILGAYTEGNEIQFVSTSVHPTTGNAAVYHGVISNITTTPSVQANYWGIDTLDLGYPNISFAGYFGGKNSSIISFDYSGPNAYPGMGAFYFDGTQYSGATIIKTGDSCIKQVTGKQQRWGDYMGSQVQWDTIGNVWVNGIYGRKDKNYGNFMAKLASPNTNGIITVPPFVSDSRLFPNPAFEYVRFEFELADDGVINFSVYNVVGKKVDEILQQHCEAGKNRIQFNVASLSPGIYFLKAQNTKGKEVMVKRFIKQ